MRVGGHLGDRLAATGAESLGSSVGHGPAWPDRCAYGLGQGLSPRQGPHPGHTPLAERRPLSSPSPALFTVEQEVRTRWEKELDLPFTGYQA